MRRKDERREAKMDEDEEREMGGERKKEGR
jgi:hypothetical protein